MEEARSKSSEVDINHDKQNNRFVGETASGDEFFVEYSVEHAGVLNAYHTFVPPSGRGCGLGSKLCVKLFEFAEKEKHLVKPSCTYISDNFLVKNPKYLEFVAK